MELQKRVELVRAAIERVTRLKTRWRNLEAAPRSTYDQRQKAHEQWLQAEHEFAPQWENVKAILDELVPKVEAGTGGAA